MKRTELAVVHGQPRHSTNQGRTKFVNLLLSVVLPGMMMAAAHAQRPVSVGRGSYADQPPATAGDKIRQFATRDLNLVQEDDRPIPTNQWWSDLLVNRFPRSLWVSPLKVDTNERGLEVFFPTRWANAGNDPVSEFPVAVGGKDFQAAGVRAKQWSDWGLVFRMGQSPVRYIDVTLLRGAPYVWIEYAGVQPQFRFQGAADCRYFDLTGRPIALPLSADCLGIQNGGRCHGLFAPDGTRFLPSRDGIDVLFAGKSRYLVLCPLPARKDLAYFHRYAFAIPRDSKLAWKYDPARGEVATTWTITTEVLKGSESQVIQGWLPHHYRRTSHDLAFNKLEYLSRAARCAAPRAISSRSHTVSRALCRTCRPQAGTM